VIVIVLIGVPVAFFAGWLFAVDAASPDSAGVVAAVVEALVPALVLAAVLGADVLVELSFEPQAASPTNNAQAASAATRTWDQRLVA